MIEQGPYRLIETSTPDYWNSYHTIRKRILWESRGLSGVYRDDHPDEVKAGNFPMILLLEDKIIGVVRIDIDPERKLATMRRVAIIEREQRKGHGRTLVELVERFAANHACNRIEVAAANDAETFYQKGGYSITGSDTSKMEKTILLK